MDLKVCEKEAVSIINTYCPAYAFKFDNATRRFGMCDHTAKTISLSRKLVELNNWDIVRLTILHEVAHAIVGHKHGHDDIWKSKCLEIGGDGKTLCDMRNINVPTLRYVAVCYACGYKHSRATMPKRLRECCCGKGTPFDRTLLFEDTWEVA